MPIVDSSRPITGGVDTHLDNHVAAALDANGGLLEVQSFPNSAVGFVALHDWLRTFGPVGRVGVEGTGAYGAGLSRYLQSCGLVVIEVDRTNRQVRRMRGKSDPVDAIEAARAALSGRASGIAKTGDGNVEAIRALLIAQRSGREARARCLNQIRHLGFTSPDRLCEQFRDVPKAHLAARAAALRPRADGDPVLHATKLAMRTLGRRALAISDDMHDFDPVLARLVASTAPELLACHGVGVDTAAILLVAAGDNPERIRNEAAWTHLCGVAPLDASSGKHRRHRLSRAGNRQANHALWRIVFTRMAGDERTRKYVARRLAEGRTTRQIMRALKRYVARELYPHLAAG
jgi:transposase